MGTKGDENMKLYINTLGNFDIKVENQSMLKEASRQYRLYKLFQYFITFRNKKLLPETIIDNLFPENESADPKNVLRTQIFRLRQLIKTFLPSNEDESEYLNICFTNGYYSLEIGDKTILDVDEYESLINQGDNARSVNIEEAAELYMKALELYKGYFLSENAYEVWLVPSRNYYNRLYLKTLFKLIDLLKEKEKNEEIMEICEGALLIEPYEESIHIYLMDAMLKLGQISNAISHYEYTTSMLEKEVGVKASPGLKDIYRKIQNYFVEKSDLDINNIRNKLEDNPENGALQCDFEYFKFLYNMQKRKSKRHNEFDYISIITFNENNKNNEIKDLKNWTKKVSDIIKGSLRNGDAFTFWNDTQVLLMLHEVKDDGLEKIENRIKKNLYNHNVHNATFKFQPLISENNIIKM